MSHLTVVQAVSEGPLALALEEHARVRAAADDLLAAIAASKRALAEQDGAYDVIANGLINNTLHPADALALFDEVSGR